MKRRAPSVRSEEGVYIIDDDPAVLDALSRLMRSAGLTSRCFSSARAFLDEALEDAPSCLVLDLSLPGPSGLDVQETLHRQGREIPIVFITGHGDVPSTVRAMKAGALDFLEKPFSDDDLLRAIHAALEGDRRARAGRAEVAAIRERFERLTPRERDVLREMAEGKNNAAIAAALVLTERSVEKVIHSIFLKLGLAWETSVHKRVKAVILYLADSG